MKENDVSGNKRNQKIIWNRRQPRKCVERPGSGYRKRGILRLTERALENLARLIISELENTLDNPNLITPKESNISIEGNTLNTQIGAMTFAVYKFKKESK